MDQEEAREGGRDHGTPARGSAPKEWASQAGGVIGFSKLLGRVDTSTLKSVCEGLADTAEEYDDAERAVKVRDLRSLNKLVEELRWTEGAEQSCRIR